MPDIGRWGVVDPLADTEWNVFFSPYNYVLNNPVLMIDPNGEDWFVSNVNGAMINIKGQSEFSLSALRKEYGNEVAQLIYDLGESTEEGWENFGEDTMFDSEDDEDNVSDGLGGITLMNSEQSEKFMNDHGYFKALEQEVKEVDFIMYEQDAAGTSRDEGGKKEIVSSKVTYKNDRSQLGEFEQRVDKYNYPLLKYKVKQYRQVIYYWERESKGSEIKNKAGVNIQGGLKSFGPDIFELLLKGLKRVK